MTMATAVLGLSMATLAACGSDAGSDGSASPTTATSAATSAAPTDDAAASLTGDWQIPAEDYVLHLKDDGTFVQDYMGVIDFRTGTYTVDGEKISLVGDDGDTDEGTIVDDTLEFTLGTATRLE